MDRYLKNGIFTDGEMDKIKSSKICIVGCGGLGGYILEMLVRLGVGNLTIVDGDVFDYSNLNRQILSNEANIGLSKVLEGRNRAKAINHDANITIVNDYMDEKNVDDIIKSSDLVVDALDSISARRILANSCKRNNKILVYGAIAGWYGQVSTIYPEDSTLDVLLPNNHKKGVEVQIGNPSFTPALIASVQVSEVVKLICSKEDTLRNKIMYVDLLYNDFEVISL